VTKSTPLGSADQPVDPSTFALGCNASFVARSVDTDAPHLGDVLRRAATHVGTAFMEIYQNCPVFNDGAFDSFTDKSTRADRQVRVVHGKPLLFGASNDKGLRLNPKTLSLEVVTLGENDVTLDDIAVHDETNSMLAAMLARMTYPAFPMAIGVLFAERRPTYDGTLAAQQQQAQETLGKGDLAKLLRGGHTWEI
jgi:2-oxoglutarate ferredoxin oxidoreductase subunit beta